MRNERTTCCVVGGGPAGMMAGLLLARQGVDVVVLERLGADGRNSDVRRLAGLEVVAQVPPIDVLWFRISRRSGDEVAFFRNDGRRVVVSINLAIQDAVAAANLLGPALRSGGASRNDLRRAQRRRELPTRVTQTFQVRALRGLYPRADETAEAPGPARRTRLPIVLRAVRLVPPLRHLTGRFIGLGIRPEHIATAG